MMHVLSTIHFSYFLIFFLIFIFGRYFLRKSIEFGNSFFNSILHILFLKIVYIRLECLIFPKGKDLPSWEHFCGFISVEISNHHHTLCWGFCSHHSEPFSLAAFAFFFLSLMLISDCDVPRYYLICFYPAWSLLNFLKMGADVFKIQLKKFQYDSWTVLLHFSS